MLPSEVLHINQTFFHLSQRQLLKDKGIKILIRTFKNKNNPLPLADNCPRAKYPEIYCHLKSHPQFVSFTNNSCINRNPFYTACIHLQYIYRHRFNHNEKNIVVRNWTVKTCVLKHPQGHPHYYRAQSPRRNQAKMSFISLEPRLPQVPMRSQHILGRSSQTHSSVDPSPPPPDSALQVQIPGCWNSYFKKHELKH